jgi:uncharacterized protein (AIM24 family)
MQVSVRHQPSFALARLTLAPGEPVQVESGAMMATSYGVTVQSQAKGGIMKGLGRKAAQGAVQSMKSGEGLVFDFAGPGQVMVQTRNPAALVSRLVSHAPSRS